MSDKTPHKNRQKAASIPIGVMLALHGLLLAAWGGLGLGTAHKAIDFIAPVGLLAFGLAGGLYGVYLLESAKAG